MSSQDRKKVMRKSQANFIKKRNSEIIIKVKVETRKRK